MFTEQTSERGEIASEKNDCRNQLQVRRASRLPLIYQTHVQALSFAGLSHSRPFQELRDAVDLIIVATVRERPQALAQAGGLFLYWRKQIAAN